MADEEEHCGFCCYGTDVGAAPEFAHAILHLNPECPVHKHLTQLTPSPWPLDQVFIFKGP